MTFDIIVFSQKELENALNSGITSIALCDNSFILPNVCGICYTAIGNIKASTNTSKEEFGKMNIVCDGFRPRFINKNTLPINTVSSKSSVSSYLSSYFISSYFMSSYTTSYMYEYEYSKGSFTSSYTASFHGSMSSFQSSFLTSVHNENECILVNGYGINLI